MPIGLFIELYLQPDMEKKEQLYPICQSSRMKLLLVNFLNITLFPLKYSEIFTCFGCRIISKSIIALIRSNSIPKRSERMIIV